MPEENPNPNNQNSNNPPTPASIPATESTPTNQPTPPNTPKVQKHSNLQQAKPPKKWLLPVTIILAVLAVAGISTSVYAFVQNARKDAEISDLKSELNQQKPDQQNPSDQPSTSPNPETPDDNPNNVSEILAKVPENLIIKSDNIVYTTSSATYKDYNLFAMSYSWNFYDNSGETTIYWDSLSPNLNYNHKTGTETISDFGPTEGHVIDIIFGRFGNGSGDECFLFLMDDGTVEYTPYYLALKENNFRSRGKLENIDGVIKFYNITNAHTTQSFSGYRTVLAQRADGTLYDLSSTITKLNLAN